MNRITFLISSLLVATLIASCATRPRNTAEDHRSAILQVHDNTIAEFSQLKDSGKAEIEAAPGYAVFNSAGINLLLVSGGGGRGVVVDNRTGENTFMNMAEIGAGLGIGVEDVRVIFIFHNAAALDDFIANGVTIGASATAAAKIDDRGDAGSGEVVLNDMSIYQITDNGLALDLMVSGTKYWPDSNLN